MTRLSLLNDWLIREGRDFADSTMLLEALCARLGDIGIPLARCWLHIRTLHPNYAGLSRIWQKDAPLRSVYLDYGFERSRTYLDSPVHLVAEQRKPFYWRLGMADTPNLPVLGELLEAGYTGYAIAPLVYSDGAVNVVSWCTKEPGGFTADDVALLQDMLPVFAMVMEIKSLRRFAGSVLATYVGREPASLILNGQIRRGDVRTTTAALMLVDLRDFTALSDALAPAVVIETLNRYFDCIIPPVRSRGGEVMEFMGDAILVIFNENAERSAASACQSAHDATVEALQALRTSNAAQPPGSVVLQAWFALHHGEVSYGNIGSDDRLDFTVIGPDVNLTSRIERLCREIGREVIMSSDFANLLVTPADEIGHFHLRGFARMQSLFGLAIGSTEGGGLAP